MPTRNLDDSRLDASPQDRPSSDRYPAEDDREFWRLPWVQNLLPFLASVGIHASILLVGVVFFYGVTRIGKKFIRPDTEVVIPSNAIVREGPPGGVPASGLTHDWMHDPGSDDPLATTAGLARTANSSFSLQEPRGATGDSSDTTIGLGPGGGIGHRSGGLRIGNGSEGGPLATFGPSHGGAFGPVNPIFGRSSNATRIVYLCDASGSMLNKFSILRRELASEVHGLKPNASFNTLFFQQTTFDAPDQGRLMMATPENKLRAVNFMEDHVVPRGSTNPLPGLDAAFKQNPQVIFLLTDGDFPDNHAVRARIAELNKARHVKVNTIAFVSDADTDTEFLTVLKEIARDTGGNYRLVKASDVQ